MRLKQVIEALELKPYFVGNEEVSVTGGYASDLLSDVMANAGEGDIWLTMQTHVNIVAVAGLVGASAILITGGRKPDADTLKRAGSEGVNIVTTDLPTFSAAGKLYHLLEASK